MTRDPFYRARLICGCASCYAGPACEVGEWMGFRLWEMDVEVARTEAELAAAWARIEGHA